MSLRKTITALLMMVFCVLSVSSANSFAEESHIGNDGVPYTVYYDANGGDSAPFPTTAYGFESYGLIRISNSTPIRDGFTFAGWSNSPDGESKYQPGDLVTFTAKDSVIFAVWSALEPVATTGDTASAESIEPLGEISMSKGNRTSRMFDFSSMMVLTLGIVAILGIATYGGILIYRSVRDF